MVQVLKGLLNFLLRRGKLINSRFEIVYSRELQHFVLDRSWRNNVALNACTFQYQRQVRHLKNSAYHAEWEDCSTRG